LSDIIFEVKNHIGHILLNCPQRLNAINSYMAALLQETLQKWAENSEIHAVIIQGAGQKAFCAGGDLKEIYTLFKSHQMDVLETFFLTEYLLSAFIARYPKPYIAFMNGITMGGGMGLAMHGSHRMVTENSLLAMPENRIGFFPDVGAAYFLNQCPGQLGLFLALTGYRLTPADALYSGLATGYIPQESISHAVQLLETTDLSREPYETIGELLNLPSGVSFETSLLKTYRSQIDALFSLSSVEEIMAAIGIQRDKFWYQILDCLEALCPLSLKITYRLMRWATRQPLHEVIKLEYHLSQKFLKDSTFLEGIRAVVIEKDNCPYWQPQKLEDVTNKMIEAYFA